LNSNQIEQKAVNLVTLAKTFLIFKYTFGEFSGILLKEYNYRNLYYKEHPLNNNVIQERRPEIGWFNVIKVITLHFLPFWKK